MLDVRAILGVALLAIYVGAHSQELRHDTATAQKNETTDQKKPDSKNGAISAESKKPKPAQQASKKPNANSEKLKIDREMAEYTRQLAAYTKELSKYTEDVSRFTLWLVIATVVIAIIGMLQWFETRNTAKRQLRAYVTVTRSGPIENDLSPGLPAFQVWIKNSGQTPAYDVRSWRGVGIHEVPLAKELPPPSGVTDADAVLGPGADSVLPIRRQRPFSPEQEAMVRAGTHAIYVFGRVEYRDAFGRDQYTNFCSYQTPGGAGAGLKHSPKGNDAS